jgi:hypothetical protein
LRQYLLLTQECIDFLFEQGVQNCTGAKLAPLFGGYRVISGLAQKLTTLPHLVPTVRMNGIITPVRHMPLWDEPERYSITSQNTSELYTYSYRATLPSVDTH